MSEDKDDLDKTVTTDFSQIHSEQTAPTVQSPNASRSHDQDTMATVAQNLNDGETLTLGAQPPMQTGGTPSATPQIPGYEIMCILGEGGMGVVYEAKQLALNRTVALKVLKPAVAAEPEFRERFLRESTAAGKVNHANVVQIFDAGEADGHLYMTFQLVRGGDLSQLLKSKGVLSEYKSLNILRDCALGIQAIEQAGLVHRDIKPGNIFMEDGRRAVIGDLGLARQTSGDDRMTMTGASMGTPSYMSPEHISGIADVDIRTDIYALGSTLYKMLTGEEPFQGETVFAITHSILSMPIPDPRELNPSLSNPVIGIIRKSMAKERDQRYRTSEQLIQDIDAAMGGHQLLHAEGLGKIEGLPKKDEPEENTVEQVSAKPAAAFGSARRQSALVMWLKPIMFIGVLLYFLYLIPMLTSTSSSRWKPDWGHVNGKDTYGRYVDVRFGDQLTRFRLVRALAAQGDFVMGAEVSEPGFQDFEAMHAVKLDREYWIADSEVTQALWDEIMGDLGEKGENPSGYFINAYYPVLSVNWDEAQLFCEKLNERMAGGNYEVPFHARLPQEKEWEFACRTGNSRAHMFGDQDVYEPVGHCAALDVQEIWQESWSDKEGSDAAAEKAVEDLMEKDPDNAAYLPLLVKNKQPNKWGLYDMIGNASEWCVDSWDGESAYSNAQEGDFRVLRGGSWYEHPHRCRAASRMAMDPKYPAVYVGMRIIIEIAVPE
ncbi:MAG: SUMF1/EgtB/PvdO family nonheme iron enzyme [Planctomycetes bacterium]|nr:SUMF1/EgtB/PvdO family nonheme iron enzyme [Planctomycetota bacterium]